MDKQKKVFSAEFWWEALGWISFIFFAAVAAMLYAPESAQSALDNVPYAAVEGDYEEDCLPPDDPDYDCACDGGPVKDVCFDPEDDEPFEFNGEHYAAPVQ